MAKLLVALGFLATLSGCPIGSHIDTSNARQSLTLCLLGVPPIGADNHFSPAFSRWLLTVLKSGQHLCGWVPPGT